MKQTALFTIAAALFLSGCNLPGDRWMDGTVGATINGNPVTGTLSFSNIQGDKIVLNISSSESWVVSKKPDWLQVNPSSGNGPGSVTLTATGDNESNTPLDDEVVFFAANGDKLTIKVQQGPDLYLAFKADDTPRWEWQGGALTEKSSESIHTFVTDTGGNLFAPPLQAKYKTGRITAADGSAYEFIEFDAPPAVGKAAGAQVHTQLGTTPVHSLKVVKIAGTKLWIVFNETSTSQERRIVQ
jgi:hypothetical protein